MEKNKENKTAKYVLSHVKKLGEEYLLNKEQVEQLMGFTIVDKEEREDLFSTKDTKGKSFIFEMIGLIQQIGYDDVYEYLLGVQKSYMLEENIENQNKRRLIIMENPVFVKNKKTLYMALNNFKHPVNISEGIVKCRNCGSKDTISSFKQTRSADEPRQSL